MKKHVSHEMCPILKRGELCFGGRDADCGLWHWVPLRYCPNIAKGVPCKSIQGGCGLQHQPFTFQVPCVNGIRNGKPCRRLRCQFRHADDGIPIPSDEMIAEKAKLDSYLVTEIEKCPFIARGNACVGF